MRPDESTVFSVIVKIWVENEDSLTKTGRVTWRGQITHVPRDEKRSVKQLSDITQFITHYLEELGVEINE